MLGVQGKGDAVKDESYFMWDKYWSTHLQLAHGWSLSSSQARMRIERLLWSCLSKNLVLIERVLCEITCLSA